MLEAQKQETEHKTTTHYENNKPAGTKEFN